MQPSLLSKFVNMEPAHGNVRDVPDRLDTTCSAAQKCQADVLHPDLVSGSKKIQEICMLLHGKLAAKEVEIETLQLILKSLSTKLSSVSKTGENQEQENYCRVELNASMNERKADKGILDQSFKTIDSLHDKMNKLQEKLLETRRQNMYLLEQIAMLKHPTKRESTFQQAKLEEKDLIIADLMQRLKKYELRDKEIKRSNDAAANSKKELARNSSPQVVAAPNNTNCGDGQKKDCSFYRSKSNVLEQQLGVVQAKYDALQQHHKEMHEEVSTYKKYLNNLKEDNETLKKILQVERERIAAREIQSKSQLQLCTREMDEIKKKCVALSAKAQAVNDQYMHAKDVILQQDLYIAKLEENAKALEEHLKSLGGDFLFSCRDLNRKEFISILDCLESTKNNLIEHNRTLAARVEQERMANDTLREQIALQRHRVGKLEAKLCCAMRNIKESPIAVKSSIVSEMYGTKSSSPCNNLSAEPKVETPRVDLQKALDVAYENILDLERKNRKLKEEKENDAKTFECFLLNAKERLLQTIMEQKAFKSKATDDGEVVTMPANTEQVSVSTTLQEVKCDA